MAWLKLDEHIPENKKAQNLSAELFKFWINTLCICKATDGKFNLDDAAFRLRPIPMKRILSNLEKLRVAELVEFSSGTYRMHDWDRWQYKADASKERMRNLRNKRRNSDGSVTDDIAEGDASRDEPVTQTVTDFHSVSVSVNSVLYSAEVKVQEQQTALAESWFEDFWSGFWRKIAKAAAKKAFRRKVTTREQFDTVIASRDAQMPSMMLKEEQFRPHASTWLNGERWEDEAPNLPRIGRSSGGDRGVLRAQEELMLKVKQ